MKALTRIIIAQTYADIPPDERGRRILVEHAQSHRPVNKVVEGDLRELLAAAKHLIGSLDEQNLKPAGISLLRAEVAKFNIDGPRY